MPPRPGTKHASKLYAHFENAAKKDIENSIALARAYLGAYDKAVIVKSKKKNGGNEDFVKEDKWINGDLSRDVKDRGYMTRSELIRLMDWKLHHGKFRGTLKGNIKKNSEASVQSISKATLGIMAANGLISRERKKDAIKSFSKLVSVGPATASAFLSTMYPAHFAFMSDEPLEAVTGRRKWELNEYLSYNDALADVSKRFSNKLSVHEIEKALWACGQLGFDATIADDVDSNGKRKAMDYANEKGGKRKKKNEQQSKA